VDAPIKVGILTWWTPGCT